MYEFCYAARLLNVGSEEVGVFFAGSETILVLLSKAYFPFFV